VADVEPLRHVVERESNQRFNGRSAHLCVSECLTDKQIANAFALAIRRHEQLCQKPKLATNPTPGEADNFSVVIRYP